MTEGGLRCQGIFDKKSRSTMPLVSIITVTKNSAETVEDTILSILNQTYDNIEYIIIDGKSTDNTLNLIGKYNNRLAYWTSDKDKNLYDAMNKGIKLSTGDIIGIVNSDDWLELNAVESVVATLIENPGTELTHGNLIIRSLDGRFEGLVKPRLYETAFYISLPFYHPTCFVTKRTYERLGMFDISYPIMADYELFLRFKKNDVSMRYIDKAISNMRTGGKSDRPESFMRAMKESLLAKKSNNVNMLLSLIGVGIHSAKYYIYQLLRSIKLYSIIQLYRKLKSR